MTPREFFTLFDEYLNEKGVKTQESSIDALP